MDNREWFKQAKYGMMVHWGLYSLLGGEWKNQKSTAYSEWIQAACDIPVKEYEKLAKAFNPVFFDAEEWIRFAKDCGMNYFVITSKHHDGFALFKSRVDPYNVVDATPFGRDVIGELAEACYKHGLKFGLYYSQDLDWTGMRSMGEDTFPDISPAPVRLGATTGISPTTIRRITISAMRERSSPKSRRF